MRHTKHIQTICLHDNKVLTKKIYVDYAMLIRNVGVVSTGKINANILN